MCFILFHQPGICEVEVTQNWGMGHTDFQLSSKKYSLLTSVVILNSTVNQPPVPYTLAV